MENLLNQFSTIELTIFGVLIFTFLVQMFTWLGYSLIATHRHPTRLEKGAEPPAVSIIVVIEEDFYFLEHTLPLLVDQQYSGEWEIVVVNDCGGSEIQQTLEAMAVSCPRLHHTTLRTDDRFKHSRKIPLLIGIKAAKHPNILVADPTAVPATNKWLALMARGFVGSKIVIGYTGFVDGTHRFIRSSRLMSSMRYLRAAVVGNPYRGIFNNIGYTKEVFFKSRGFSHLRMALGEDDLFIQKLAPYCDASVIVSPSCTMRQTAYGGLRWWFAEQRYRTFAFKFYPSRVKFSIFFELCTKLLFFLSLASTALLPIAYIWIYAISIFVVRELIVLWSSRRVMRRLGEKHLLLAFLLYELVSPFSEAVLAISRRFSPPGSVWK